MQNTIVDTTKLTRVEVIDKDGRSYVKMDAKRVELSVQDKERTLKIFID